MTNELKPCPFCGENPNSGCNYGIGGAYVNCINIKCKCKPEVFIAAVSLEEGLAEAKIAWNTRVQPIMGDASTRKDEEDCGESRRLETSPSNHSPNDCRAAFDDLVKEVAHWHDVARVSYGPLNAALETMDKLLASRADLLDGIERDLRLAGFLDEDAVQCIISKHRGNK